MVDDEQPTNDNAEPAIPSGPRRSTFTPPPADAAYDPSATDDDALAGALSEQFERWVPPAPATPVVANDPVTEPPAEFAPDAAQTFQAAPVASEPASPGESAWQPEAWEPAPWQPPAESAVDASLVDAVQAPPADSFWSEPVPEAPAQPIVYDLSQAGMAGSAEPDFAVAPEPASTLPPPPQRLSLTDAELLQAANIDDPHQDTSSLLDLVERELVLRQIEAQRLAEWEKQVRATAAPEADEIVTQVRERFTGVVPVIPAASEPPLAAGGLSVAEQLASAPPPAAPPPAAPPPVVVPPVVVPPAAPIIDLALADAPPPYGIVPSAAVAPPLSVPAPTDDGPEPVFVAPAPLIEPSQPEPVGFESAAFEATAFEATAFETTAFETPAFEPAAVETPAFDAPAFAPAVVEPAAFAAAPAVGGSFFDELLREPVEPDAAVSASLGGDPFAGVSSDPASVDAARSDSAEQTGLDLLAGHFAEPEGATIPPDVDSDSSAELAVPVGPRAGHVEKAALEPTPAEKRAGRSIRLFWLWFAVNSSVVSIALGAVILGLGVSLRQAVMATLLGVALSFLPLGLGTLAGKRSGQPTMVVSRSTFGTAGNAIPALVAVFTRLAWAAALLWMLGIGVAEVLIGSGLVPGVGRLEIAIVTASIGLVIAALVAGFGFGLIAVVSAIVSIISVVLVVGLVVLTASYVDIEAALALPDGDWALLLSGAVLVFSVVGLAWANSSGDVARYQAKGTLGGSAVLFSAFGATIPAFVVICWGAILAASNPVLAEGLAENPLDLVSRLLPLWYPIPLIAAIALSLISAAALALYSGGFAVLAMGVRASRPGSVGFSIIVTGALVAVLLVIVPDTAALFRDVVTTLAVPVAAWAGIFGAETMIRSRRVHSPSLVQSGGVYPAVRWVNLIMLLLITGVGWGMSTAALVGLQWQGYIFTALGVDPDSALASSDPGVFVALVLGLLTPIIMGIPALRRLQRAEKAAAEAESAAGAENVADEEGAARAVHEGDDPAVAAPLDASPA
ncbi:MAG: hypothetical protein C0444_04895 [Microbacterium sp.]|nr:hypothetical protein [Microbacterium sp.]MBA4347137.1 hypothetical protein [Microbacterium sp.]